MGLPQPGRTRQQPPTDQWFGFLAIVAWRMTVEDSHEMLSLIYPEKYENHHKFCCFQRE